MKKVAAIIFFALALAVSAQGQYHEISANVGGGLSSLQYSPSSGGQKPRAGMNFGLGYHYFFDTQWGIGTGLSLSFYNGRTSLNNFSANSEENAKLDPMDNPDIKGDFTFTYDYHPYNEKQHTTMLTIPLMVQFQTKGYTVFYAALGGKVGIPLSSYYSVEGTLSTTGLFHATEVTYYDDLPREGFGNYHINQPDNNLKLKPSFMLSAETGAKFYLGEWIVYAGVYCDYGLNDIRKDKRNLPLVGYQADNPSEFNYASILNMSDKLKTLSVGITLRLSIPILQDAHGSLSRGMIVPMVGPATNRLRR